MSFMSGLALLFIALKLMGFVIAMRDGVTHEEIMENIAAADKEALLALADARGER